MKTGTSYILYIIKAVSATRNQSTVYQKLDFTRRKISISLLGKITRVARLELIGDAVVGFSSFAQQKKKETRGKERRSLSGRKSTGVLYLLGWLLM